MFCVLILNCFELNWQIVIKRLLRFFKTIHVNYIERNRLRFLSLESNHFQVKEQQQQQKYFVFGQNSGKLKNIFKLENIINYLLAGMDF